VLEGEDKPLLPAELEVHSPTSAHLTIHEGRYHQVRRMFAAVGNHVEALHRDQVGGLSLPDDLEPGRWRLMSDEDVAQVFAG
jgi:16S rRNA pseudouridine516 synthase